MLLSLELCKKNGDSKRNIVSAGCEWTSSTDSDKPGEYLTLGFFDNLHLEPNRKFSDLLGTYTKNDLTSKFPYNRYTLPLFTIEGIKPKGNAPLCKVSDPGLSEICRPENDTYIYQFTLLKLNPEIIQDQEQGMPFFRDICTEIESCLRESLDAFYNEISYSILGGMGAFDFLLICAIDSSVINLKSDVKWERKLFDKYGNEETESEMQHDMSIWDAVQRISVVLRNRRIKQAESANAIFDFSSTFFAFSPFIDFEKKESPPCIAEIKVTSLHCRLSVGSLLKKLNDQLDGIDKNHTSKFTVANMLGDEDHHISFKGELFHLLYLFCHSRFFDSHQNNYIREFHTFFLLTSSPFREDDDSAFNQHPTIGDGLESLFELYEAVDSKIPFLTKNTMENMIFVCKYLLSNDYHAITGVRMHALLFELLGRIRDTESDTKDISDAIQYFSYMIPVTLQHHAIHLYDLNDVDWISPISKIFYAYEHFITSIQREMHPKNMGMPYIPLSIFLTVGHTDQIQTKRYFANPDEFIDKILDGTKSPNTTEHLVGFNLPSIRALDPEISYSLLIHEAAHYGQIATDKKSRNDSYYDLFLLYMELEFNLIANKKGYYKDQNMFKSFKGIFKDDLDKKYNLNKKYDPNKSNIHTKRLGTFSKDVIDMASNIQNDLSDIIKELESDEELENLNKSLRSLKSQKESLGNATYTKKRVSDLDNQIQQLHNEIQARENKLEMKCHHFRAIESILKDINLLGMEHTLKTVMWEAYADVIMFEICEFTWKDYASFYIKYLKDNCKNILGDNGLTLRTATVYCYSLLIKNRKLLKAAGGLRNIVATNARQSLSELNIKFGFESKSPAEQELIKKDIEYSFYEQTYKLVEKYFEHAIAVSLPIAKASQICDLRTNLDAKLFPYKETITQNVDEQINFFLTHWMRETQERLKQLGSIPS